MSYRKTLRTHAQNISPLGSGHCLAVSGNKNICTLVATLLSRCRPANISSFIVSINIDTIKRMIRCRLAANRRQKFFKTFKSKFDTASAVVRVGFMFQIMTSSPSVSVRCPFYSALATGCVAMFSTSGYRHLTRQASTRLHRTFFQITSFGNAYRATVAQAFPHCASRLGASSKSLNGQPSESLSGQIDKSSACGKWVSLNGRIVKRHIVSLTDNLARLAGSLQRSCGLFLLYQNQKANV